MQVYRFFNASESDPTPIQLEKLFDCLLGLSRAEISVLMRILAHPGNCCQELARAERKDRSVVQKVVKKLFDRGLIRREELERGKLTYMPLPPDEMRDLLLRRIDETRLRMIDVVYRAFGRA
ncbi:MAG: helix-turn-helix domain-containing protein [Candidatus Sigynarchaeota archaeon]